MHHIFDIDLIALYDAMVIFHSYRPCQEGPLKKKLQNQVRTFLPPFMFSVYMSGSRWRPNDQIISLTPVSSLLNNSLDLNNRFNF